MTLWGALKQLLWDRGTEPHLPLAEPGDVRAQAQRELSVARIDARLAEVPHEHDLQQAEYRTALSAVTKAAKRAIDISGQSIELVRGRHG